MFIELYLGTAKKFPELELSIFICFADNISLLKIEKLDMLYIIIIYQHFW